MGSPVTFSAWRAVKPEERADKLRERVIRVWDDPVFRQRAGGGKPANRRIPYMVEVGIRVLDPSTD